MYKYMQNIMSCISIYETNRLQQLFETKCNALVINLCNNELHV